MTDSRRSTALGRFQCEELLAQHHLARVALNGRGGLRIHPVSYRFHDQSVVFRTTPDSVLGGLAHPQPVAVLVDQLDEESRSGWSVLLQGTSRGISDLTELAHLWTVDELSPWGVGVHTVFVEVRAEHVTGRAFSAGPAGPGPVGGELS
ncbi:pyridoxamine 5'-phosphate oxidase family protein [Auraticoccus monumenti]|uniref:Nitroimidazol reductase NimA, pyridoxamine 5'-phosphate oxidase superfamily n=1 Tax=Auraticoccus monumenti TaxID=675864 RepID=A0A1G6WDY2_9ACTN|nr:pyridoxamine 5'-phosphate oxidase family protein [Auraticoccus monumenti]SDD63457.1 Nitroimidazol reductase NimA, pyridoxamine 5'-phosphate oxidase superfamily [Auraticoccus monumenti]